MLVALHPRSFLLACTRSQAHLHPHQHHTVHETSYHQSQLESTLLQLLILKMLLTIPTSVSRLLATMEVPCVASQHLYQDPASQCTPVHPLKTGKMLEANEATQSKGHLMFQEGRGHGL